MEARQPTALPVQVNDTAALELSSIRVDGDTQARVDCHVGGPVKGENGDDAFAPLLLMPAPDLKSVIMDAYFAGCITQAEAEDLIVYYGLRNA
jgi:hypothetical protein